MANGRIELQCLKIERDGVLGFAGLELHIAEVAPAPCQMRRQPQRGLVVCAGTLKIASDHAGIAELGMQLRNRLDRHAAGRLGLGRGEPAPIRGNRGFDPAGGIIFQPDAQLLGDEGAGDIVVRETGGEGGCGHGLRITAMGSTPTLSVLSKQNPANDSGREIRR